MVGIETLVLSCCTPSEAMSVMEPTSEDRQQAMERDGFFKTALIACAANFFAINHEFAPDQISSKAARMAEHLWDEVVKYRRKHVK